MRSRVASTGVLVVFAACSHGALEPGAGNDPGMRTGNITVGGTVVARPLHANAREPTEFTTALNRADAGNFATFAVGWSGRVDPDGNFYQFVNTKGSQNDSGYSNPTVDKATNQARAVLKLDRRIGFYHTALVQVAQDLPLIYLYYPINRFGVSKTVGGVSIYGDGLIRAQFAGFKKGT